MITSAAEHPAATPRAGPGHDRCPLALPALTRAWLRVRSNGGCAGADGTDIATFAIDAGPRLRQLARCLETGAYRPGQLLRVRIRKPSGGQRLLAIPTVTDRVVQTSVAFALSGALDARMSAGSFGYRAGRGVDDALSAFRLARRRGRLWTLDADIRAFFDQVPHAQLMNELSIWLEDPRLLRLVADWLKGFGGRGRGLAQGSPISPVLSNLYLHPLDRGLERRGYAILRYADDFVVPVMRRADALAARDLAGGLLRERGLRLNAGKTHIRSPSEAFVFLGETIGGRAG